jgi:hypothetical protein
VQVFFAEIMPEINKSDPNPDEIIRLWPVSISFRLDIAGNDLGF